MNRKKEKSKESIADLKTRKNYLYPEREAKYLATGPDPVVYGEYQFIIKSFFIEQ